MIREGMTTEVGGSRDGNSRVDGRVTNFWQFLGSLLEYHA
jgi:hypothetical protein